MEIAMRFSLRMLIAATAIAASLPFCLAQSGYFAFTGTYTRGAAKGIYAFRYDPATGKTTAPELAVETSNPSFLAVHPNQNFLYAVNEVNNFGGQNAGSATAFAIDRKTGRLRVLNAVSTVGAGPCFASVDHTGKWLIVANYGSGSVASIAIRDDGSLGDVASFIQHKGSSVNPQRQLGPHAHEALLSPDNRFVLVPDLGMDKVMSYRLDTATGKLTPADPPFTSIKAGLGPRHAAFHPNGEYLFVLSEIGSTVTVLRYDKNSSSAKEIQTISTLPADFRGESTTAEIEVSRDGRFVYASNRGLDALSLFSFDAQTGRLTLTSTTSTGGKVPRHFAIAPKGDYVFAENQASDNIVLFRRDPRSGALTPTGDTIAIPSPVCIVFVPAA
jgi:6-phosphogluconolactonase